MSTNALAIRGLEKTFAAFHLGPVDLTVPAGAIYGLVGPNGAGKTTTMDLIMGMGMQDAGKIEVFGFDHMKDEVELKKRVGYVSPNILFNAWKTIGRLLNFVRAFYEDWDDDYCLALLKRLRLGWDDVISTLSFGSRTKLGLVVALSHRPKLLLLDEPTAGLDALSKQEIYAELLDAIQDEGRSVLISSHNLDDIERFADHLGVINDGRMLLEGPTADLVARFRIIDATSANGFHPESIPGIGVKRHEDGRYRLLVDLTECSIDQLRERGLTIIQDAPVTLEELFVGLLKE